MYSALYRKYRPQTFDEVIGQDKIIKTLKNQIEAGQISHAYLFCGSRGTGKTSTAKIFARAINCANPKSGSPCGECDACRAMAGDNIDVFEIDAASNNGVDQIRDLREQVKYPPVNGKYKVYIIDEVHMLSVNAFNALLKTLEEPPKFVVFILATTEVHKLPATILSRCMRFDFDLVSFDELKKHLEKICNDNKIKYEPQAINLIVRAGEGSVRDMLSAADRCISFCGNNLTADDVVSVLGVASKKVLNEIASKILAGDLGEALVKVDDALSRGKSPLVLSKDLISYFRDLLFVFTVGDKAKDYVIASSEDFDALKSLAQPANYDKTIWAINNLSEVESELRYSVSPQIVIETAIVKTISSLSLNERIAVLEQKLQNQPQNVVNNVKNERIIEEKHAQKQNEPDQNFRPVLEPVKKSAEGFDAEIVLGELLQDLRKQGALSLVAALSQVKAVNAIDNKIEFVVDDEVSADMINSNKNKILVEEYMKKKGLSFEFVSKSRAAKNAVNVKDISQFFGGKLDVE